MSKNEPLSNYIENPKDEESSLAYERRLIELGKKVTSIRWAPMIRLEADPDYYIVSIVMPRIEIPKDLITWEGGRLRLNFPEGSWPKRPRVLRWVSFPEAVLEEIPKFDYKNGRLHISIPRKKSN